MTGAVRVNGGIIDDQMLTGEIRYFRISQVNFFGAIGDGLISIPLGYGTASKVIALGAPVPNSAADQIATQISTKATVGQVDVDNSFMMLVLENKNNGWDEYNLDGTLLISASIKMQEAIRAMGTITTPTGDVDLSSAIVEELMLSEWGTGGAGGQVYTVFNRIGDIFPLVGDYAAFYAPLDHTHVEADITDLDKYSQSQVNALLADKADNGDVFSGSYTDLTDTPTEFPPAVHTHVEADITDLDKYSQSEVNALLADKADNGDVFSGSYADLTDVPSEFPPAVHTHVEADITDLDKYSQSEVDGLLADKAELVHTHVEADITDLDKYSQSEVNALLADKADNGDVFSGSYADLTDVPTEFPPSVHTHVEADITDLDKYSQSEVDNITQARMQWLGTWATGSYEANDMVRDGDWIMIANTPTSEKPAPELVDSPEWSVPIDPGFQTVQDPAFVQSGNIFTFNEVVNLTSLRIWVPAVSASTNIHIIVDNITEPDSPKRLFDEERPTLVGNEWTYLYFNEPIMVASGTVLRCVIGSIDSSDFINVNGSWTYQGNTDDPVFTASWTTSLANNAVSLSDFDSTVTDRSADLAQVIPGTKITLRQNSNPNNYIICTVSGVPVDNTDYYTYPVDSIETSGTIGINEPTIVVIEIPTPTGTEHSVVPDYWISNPQPTLVNVGGILSVDGVEDGTVSDDFFGIDLEYQEVIRSDDWDVIAVSDDEIGIGVVIGGIHDNADHITEAPADGQAYVRKDNTWEELPAIIAGAKVWESIPLQPEYVGTARYRFEDDVVRVEGVMSSVSGEQSNIICILPEGARPRFDTAILLLDTDGKIFNAHIKPNGVMESRRKMDRGFTFTGVFVLP